MLFMIIPVFFYNNGISISNQVRKFFPHLTDSRHRFNENLKRDQHILPTWVKTWRMYA
jgi:hypothetical protein